MTPALRERLSRADAILFDGTLMTDDEMIRAGLGEKTGRRMGHMPVDGPDGSIAALQGLQGLKARRIFVHINNTNPMLIDGSPAAAARRGRGLGGRAGRHGDCVVMCIAARTISRRHPEVPAEGGPRRATARLLHYRGRSSFEARKGAHLRMTGIDQKSVGWAKPRSGVPTSSPGQEGVGPALTRLGPPYDYPKSFISSQDDGESAERWVKT